MSKRLRRSLVAGAGAVAVVSLLAVTPAYAQGRTEERTYSYLDGKGSPPRQHIEVPSWATRMVVQVTGGAGGGATAKDKPCTVAGGAGTRVQVDVNLATQGRDFDLYLGQRGTTAAFQHTGGILDQKWSLTTGSGGAGWQLADRDGRRQVESANGGSSTYGGGGGGSSLLTGSAGVVALAAGGGGAGSCGGDGTGINWYWNPGGAGGSNGRGANGSEVKGLSGGSGAGGAFAAQPTAAGGSMTSGTVAGGGPAAPASGAAAPARPRTWSTARARAGAATAAADRATPMLTFRRRSRPGQQATDRRS